MSLGLNTVFRGQQAGLSILEFDRPHQLDMKRFVFGHSHSVGARLEVGEIGVPRSIYSPAPAKTSHSPWKAWAIMGMNVFLRPRLGVWGDEDPDIVAAHANRMLREGLIA